MRSIHTYLFADHQPVAIAGTIHAANVFQKNSGSFVAVAVVAALVNGPLFLQKLFSYFIKGEHILGILLNKKTPEHHC